MQKLRDHRGAGAVSAGDAESGIGGDRLVQSLTGGEVLNLNETTLPSQRKNAMRMLPMSNAPALQPPKVKSTGLLLAVGGI